jgi:hypothetical protein
MFHISFKHTTFMCKKYEPMKNEFHMIFELSSHWMESLWWKQR